MNYRDSMEPTGSAADLRIHQVLEQTLARTPEPVIPADFAARISANLPPLPPVRKPMRLGRPVALASIGILALAMFLVAPHTSPSFTSLAFDVELLLLLQMGGIGYWLTMRESRSR